MTKWPDGPDRMKSDINDPWFLSGYNAVIERYGSAERQHIVDIVRHDVLIETVRSLWAKVVPAPLRNQLIAVPSLIKEHPEWLPNQVMDWPVGHIWFEEPRVSLYEYRGGNAPSDSERPPWLRGLRLEIDPGQLPHHVLMGLRPGGPLDDNIRNKVRLEAVKFRGLGATHDPMIRS